MPSRSPRHATHPPGSETSIEDRIVIGLQQLGRALVLQSEREGYDHHLSSLQSLLIRSLLKPHHAVTIGGLANELNISAPTLSDAARALGAKGLVQKRRDGRDGRIVRLSLTARGRAMARKLEEGQTDLQRVVQSLPEDDKEKLLSLLVMLTKRFLDRGLISISRVCRGCQFFVENRSPGSRNPHYCAFAEAPIGESTLQTDCPDHIPLTLIKGK